MDDIDRRILFELERNARIPDVRLARIVNKSKDTVRYRIKRLEEQGCIVSYRAWIDYAKLGYQTATLTFTLLNIPERRAAFINTLRNDKRVSWLGIAEGVWNVAASFAYTSLQELFTIKSTLLSSYQDLILDTHIAFIAGVHVHDKDFLVEEQSRFMTFIDTVNTIELDDIAKGILRILFTDARANMATIAAQLDTTVDIVRYRMRQLEEQKVIVRYCGLPKYHALGYDLYKTYIYLKSSDELAAMMKYFEANQHIIHVVKQLAPWDLELVIFTPSFQDYNTLIAAYTTRFVGSVKKIETAIMSEDTVLPAKQLIFDP